MQITTEEIEQIEKVKYLRLNPDKFISDILGEETLEDFQAIVCKLFAEYDRLSIQACHAVGKTWLLARLVLAFLYCYPGSKVITTAPTFRQVVTLLWGEIRKAKKNSKTFLDGKLLTNNLTIDDDWYAMGFSPKADGGGSTNEQKGSSFQGFHAPFILIVFDEATGVKKDIYTMAEGLLTSGSVVKWVCIANPTTRASEFFKITKLAEWYSHKITCFDSPNMKINGFTSMEAIKTELINLKSMTDNERLRHIKNYKKPNVNLINAQWVMAKLFQWGVNHPLALSKIFAEFPSTDDNSIIKFENIQTAFVRQVEINELDFRYIGLDVARFGVDSTVTTEIVGRKNTRKEVSQKENGPQVAGRVIKFFKRGDDGRKTIILVDETGVGASALDALLEAKKAGDLPEYVYIMGVHFAQAVMHPNKETEAELRKVYENLKAYMFFLLDQDLRDNLQLTPEEVYEEELPAIKFSYTAKGRLIVQDKQEFKNEFGKSPDSADSLGLANLARHIGTIAGDMTPIIEKLKEKQLGIRSKQNQSNTEKRIKIRDY